ncbi:MAG: acyl-CoA dehydrogenase [Actinomycetia bacterium]|nr:acyl-CoA dehydrogenase [Actinomycetes bacterium]
MTAATATDDATREAAAFRAEARAWIRAHAPSAGPGARGTGFSASSDDQGAAARDARAWVRLRYESGWAGLSWPIEHGGRGLPIAFERIYAEEQTAVGISNALLQVGLGMVGPTIIKHGTPEQHDRYLTPMLRGDEGWCQLFSEPGAGSDLAAVACHAVRDGDDWVVDGQKVWTSGAAHSDWGILLARTAPDQPKHRGITCFLVDMTSPGVDVRPLRQMTGGAHFSEVFLTGVRVPAANVLGDVDGGWAVALTTLGFERNVIGGTNLGPDAEDVLTLAKRYGRTDDATFRDALARAYSGERILGFLGQRARAAATRGLLRGYEGSLAKLAHAQHIREASSLALRVLGADALLGGADAADDGVWQQYFLGGPSYRIAGGTDEIQRNLIAERGLGLPAEPRNDRTLPFRDLPRN